MLKASWPLLMHGDCLDLMQDIPDGSVDMVLADPPYEITACAWDVMIPMEPLWAHLKRIIKPHGAIAMTAGQPFTSVLVVSNPGMFRHEWIWRKNRGSNFASLKTNPFKDHESVVVFSKETACFYPIKEERSESGKSRAKYDFEKACGGEAVGRMKGGGRRTIEKLFRHPSSVQKFNTEVGLHPTQKPVSLMQYLIKTYTRPGETVLDFCMGSGTTGVAALRLDRRFIGIEKMLKYFQIAKDRISNDAPLFNNVSACRGGCDRDEQEKFGRQEVM